mmetsp:Transcript_25570/g.50116  ORF Transcript_25570/g.50116 Transcript_25570/m.50116 type:complete len:129 (+) Transcript_25570:42-428(+)
MLMRNPTRIELKAEDAQEYIKARERQRRQTGSALGVPTPTPGLATQSPAHGAPGAGEGLPGSWAPPAPMPQPRRQQAAAATGADMAANPQFQAQLEQLTAMGFSADQAHRALGAAGGDVEAAADWLLS